MLNSQVQAGFKILVAALMMCQLATASTSSFAMEKETIYLGYQGPLTGPEAAYGIDQLSAIRYAISKFNSSQINPVKVEVVIFDDQGSFITASEVASQAAADERVIGVIGPAFSGAALASIPSYKERLLPMISPSAYRLSLTSPPEKSIGYPVFHRVVATATKEGPELYRLAVSGVSSPKVFLINVDVGLNYQEGLYLSLLNSSGPLAGQISITSSFQDWMSIQNQIQSVDANVVILNGLEEQQAASLFKFLRSQKYGGVIAASSQVMTSYLLKLATLDVLNGIRFTNLTAPIDQINPEIESDFVETVNRPSGYFAAESIDATNVFLDCISLGARSRATLLNCIDSYSGLSIYGHRFSFDQFGDNSFSTIYSFVIENGVFRLINPQPSQVPVLGKIKPTINGFETSIENFDSNYHYSIASSQGLVNLGRMKNGVIPVIVSGIREGNLTTVSISSVHKTSRSLPRSASISGFSRDLASEVNYSSFCSKYPTQNSKLSGISFDGNVIIRTNGSDSIWISRDSQKNWRKYQVSPTPTSINAVTVNQDGSVIYVADKDSGKVWFSENLGLSWRKLSDLEFTGLQNLSTNGAGNILFVTSKNTLYRFSRESNLWTKINVVDENLQTWETMVVAPSGQHILITENKAAYLSSDFGENFSLVKFLNGALSRSMISNDGKIIFLRHRNGLSYVSTNFGNDWKKYKSNAISLLGMSIDGKSLFALIPATSELRISSNDNELWRRTKGLPEDFVNYTSFDDVYFISADSNKVISGPCTSILRRS